MSTIQIGMTYATSVAIDRFPETESSKEFFSVRLASGDTFASILLPRESIMELRQQIHDMVMPSNTQLDAAMKDALALLRDLAEDQGDDRSSRAYEILKSLALK